MRKKLEYRRRRRPLDRDKLTGGLIWALQIAIVCLIAFVFVWYFGQRVSNIGDSMSPALHNGDVVMVNRIVYDASLPKRGDLIVFQPNGNENLHSHIKRIIGLPGETVQIVDGQVYIDGEVLEENYETSPITDAGLAAEELTLGGDEYFVLGDNRESSGDSRMADIGNVRRSEIEGKAWFVIFPLGHFGFL